MPIFIKNSSTSLNEEFKCQQEIVDSTNDGEINYQNNSEEKCNAHDDQKEDNNNNEINNNEEKETQRRKKQFEILFQEYQFLKENALPGIYILPSLEKRKDDNEKTDNAIYLNGTIFVKSENAYEGGIFEFIIRLPPDYNMQDDNIDPSSSPSPSIFFKTPLFHPLVNEKVSFRFMER